MHRAQQHAERHIPKWLKRMAAGEIKTSLLMTHPMPLDQGAQGYDLFKNQEGRLRKGSLPVMIGYLERPTLQHSRQRREWDSMVGAG
ncbi:MAG TPA: hypothetical protein VKB53_06015 [Gammaproteobacteria bacterium]|nr:hypothetical protein [Gammaproteobacteria bacterium]